MKASCTLAGNCGEELADHIGSSWQWRPGPGLNSCQYLSVGRLAMPVSPDYGPQILTHPMVMIIRKISWNKMKQIKITCPEALLLNTKGTFKTFFSENFHFSGTQIIVPG